MTDSADFEADFAAYEFNGLVCDHKNPTAASGNSILKTAQKEMIRASGYLNQSIGGKIESSRSAFKVVLDNCAIRPGLYRRPIPFDMDQEGRDDYIGLGSLIACSVQPEFAEDILRYGESHYYQWGPFHLKYSYSVFDMHFTTKASAWLGRHVEMITTLWWIAHASGSRRSPSLWRRIWWSLSTAYAGSKNDQDGWILADMMIRVCGDRGWLERWASRTYYDRRDKIVPQGIRALLGAYLGDPDHPIAKYWPEYPLGKDFVPPASS